MSLNSTASLHHAKPKVICIGQPRTASTSMWLALQRLGYKCSDSTVRSYDLLGSKPVANNHAEWTKALESKYLGTDTSMNAEDWTKLLGRFEAITDFPAFAFVSELYEAFPDAKFILTKRPTDPWFKSVQATAIPLLKSPTLAVLEWIDPELLGSWMLMLRAMFLCVYGGKFDQSAKAVYEEHNSFVRGLIPKENLLEYSPGDGWKPLCQFLECEVPAEDFPRVNDAKAYQERWSAIVKAGCLRVGHQIAVKMSLLGLGAIAGWHVRSWLI